jgi:hypothetical protein
MPIPADNIPLGLGRNPLVEGEEVEFFVSASNLDKIEADGPTWKLADAVHVRAVIKNPDAIFEGLQREEYEDGFCYSFKPPQSPAGMVFLIFIMMNMGYVVFDWEWRPEDKINSGHPEKWDTNFGRLVWSKCLKTT